MLSTVIFLVYGDRGAKMDSKEEVEATGGMNVSMDMGRWSEKKDASFTSVDMLAAGRLGARFPCVPDTSTSLVGRTWGTLSVGAGAADVVICFFLRPACFFPLPVIFSPFSVAFFRGAFSALAGACGAEFDPFELSGGVDALDDDKRR